MRNAPAESAEVADVRRLDLSPRSFRTTVAGLFLFVPLLEGIDVGRVVQAGRLPGSTRFPNGPTWRPTVHAWTTAPICG